MLSNSDRLLIAMCLVTVEDDYILNQMRERFYKRDRPHTEWDIQAEYRLEKAKAILSRWSREVS